MALQSDISGIRPVSNQTTAVRQVTPVGDLRQEVISRLNRIDIGQQFRAEVMTRSENGTSFVRLADTVVQMNLPQDAPVGEKVLLTLVAKEPCLTFLYEQQSGSVQSSLSSAGRAIDNILRSTAQAEGGLPSSLVGKTPLLPSAASMLPTQIATALQNAIVQSGLFYEAHLAQWLVGNRTTSELKQEPQAMMKPDSETPAALAQKEGNMPSQAQQGQQAPIQNPGQKTVTVLSGNESLQKQGDIAKVLLADDATSTQPIVDKEAAQMIRMQLDAMEQRKVIWQGELFPGQEVEWEVSDDTPRQKQGMDEKTTESSWQSVLRMELPRLGFVSVTMRLTGEQVQVHMEAKNGEAANSLRTHGHELAQALKDIGTHLDYLAVKDGSA